MKAKSYNFLAAAAAVVIAFCLFSGFSASDPQDAARALICQRTDLLQAVGSGQISQSEGERRLRLIEGDSLLTQDLAELRNGTAGQGSDGFVKFGEMTLKKEFFQYVTYQGTILWDTGSRALSKNYHIVLKKRDADSYILTVFEPAKV